MMSNFFYELNKRLANLEEAKESLTESAKPAVAEGSTGDYSAKKARAGKDIGKPGKQFAKIARGAAERYGSKERGEKVAGAVLAKLRGKKESQGELDEESKPDFLDLDKDGNRKEPMKQAARQAKGVKEEQPRIGGRDMTQDLVSKIEKASGGKETARRDDKGILQLAKKKVPAKRQGPVDEVKLSDLPVRQVKGRAYGAQPEEFDQDDDIEATTKTKKVGRPKGTGRSIGAKGPSKHSKLLAKAPIREELPLGATSADAGEYGHEGDMAKDDIHTIVRHARALEKILGNQEDLPEWVQSKLAKIQGMMTAVDDYMQTQHERGAEMSGDEENLEQPLGEKAVSVAQRRAAGIARAAQKGEIPKSKLRGASKEMSKMSQKELHKFAATKERGLPAKKKGAEEVEETTTSGSVAVAPAAEAPKGKKGMQFGRGIYDSLNRELEAMIAESMSVNISTSTEGSPSVSVTATDDDAAKLASLLKSAGIGSGLHGEQACPTCGQSPCGCAEQVDENQPDWPTNTETSHDAMQYSGGLNKPKTTVAGDGQATVPVTAVQVREDSVEESVDEAKCMECGMLESHCGCDREMDESIERLQELAGVQETKNKKPDADRDGIPDWADKEPQKAGGPEDRKVEENAQSLGRLWQEYKA